MTEIMEPVESQQLYDFVINNRTKLPPTYRIRNMMLSAEQLREIYDIVATNRAKSKGTRLYFETSDDGDVSKIEYTEIKVPPQEIVTPRRKNCTGCGKEFENVLPKCPNCGAENKR